jgi:radical SAM protein with 4Fe4S-binding SPASM domain
VTSFSLGIGLTNECNLRCAHCYRPDAVVERLTRADVQRVCRSIPVRSVNLGVGENGLHPQYEPILDDLWSLAIKTSITSNGQSIAALSDVALKRFHSVEFSLDFPTEHEHDLVRGRGNWRTVMGSLERCSTLGILTTVTAVMMNTNYRRMGELAGVAAGVGANLRVNVYQPSKTDRFTLGYDQFWRGFKTLFGSARLVATSEPVLAAVLEIEGFAGPACGRSTVRVAPDGRVLPCTYWPESSLTIDDLERRRETIVETDEFADARRASATCAGCPCLGGCAGRRALTGALDAADPYCPFARGDRVTIDWEAASASELPKLASACTTVVSAC